MKGEPGLRNGASSVRRLTFTFDNGPCPGATDWVLDFLAGRSIKATFFVVGERLRAPGGRRLAERAKAEGHWIGNHTLTHGEPLGLSGTREHVEREIGETERLLGELAHPRKLFRPNGRGTLGPHVLSPEAVSYLERRRYTLVTWNNVPRDWTEDGPGWPERALRTALALPWSLLVLHDQFVARMPDTLQSFCQRIAGEGFEIVQEFPPACVPMEAGEVTGDLGGLVASQRVVERTPG